jgi:hypothetical protein
MLCSRHFRDSKERQDLSDYHDWNEALLGPSPTVDIYSIGGRKLCHFCRKVYLSIRIIGIKNGDYPHSDYLDPNRPADIVPIDYGPDFLL